MQDKEASIRGKVMRDLIAHVTRDNLIGRKIKSGELRKKMSDLEPAWRCPDCFPLTTFDRVNYTL